MKKLYFIIAIATVMCCFSGCKKELDLAHKYDNTESRKPYEEPEEDISDYTEYDNWYMSDRYDIAVKDGTPRKGYWLDGKITAIKFSWAAKFTTFWSSDASLMLENCNTPWLEDNINKLTEDNVVIGNTVQPQPGFTDGGQWFIGVHELTNERIVGFFHAESHWKGQICAYKSIGVAYSSDHGKTWTKGDKILSGTDPKPETSANDGRSYGLGDGCVVYNPERKSWICYYSGFCPNGGDFMITMAESKDPDGKAGTWKKWDGTNFTVEGCNQSTGLGGPNTAIANLASFHGGNPSVMFNTHLNKWIMVYHSWQLAIIYSESEDGIVWSKPVTIISKQMEPGGSMYPNLIGPEGDVTGGKQIRLYYSTDMVNGIRVLSCRKLSFK